MDTKALLRKKEAELASGLQEWVRKTLGIEGPFSLDVKIVLHRRARDRYQLQTEELTAEDLQDIRHVFEDFPSRSRHSWQQNDAKQIVEQLLTSRNTPVHLVGYRSSYHKDKVVGTVNSRLHNRHLPFRLRLLPEQNPYRTPEGEKRYKFFRVKDTLA